MKRFDPRLYQIGALTVLLLYGIFALNFDVTLLPRGAARRDRDRDAGDLQPDQARRLRSAQCGDFGTLAYRFCCAVNRSRC